MLVKRDYPQTSVKMLPPPCWTTKDLTALTTTIRQSAKEHIPKEDLRSAQSSPWITEEIIYLMNQGRQVKQNDVQYNLVKKKCFDAKEKWLEDQCREIEKLSCSAKQVFPKINQIAGKRSLMLPMKWYIKLEDGRILQNREDILKQWQKYIETLFYNGQQGEDIILHSAETGPRILKNEVWWAMKNMKTGKSSGMDEIPIEMLIALEDDGIDLIWEIVNRIYETGNFPEDMLKSVFVALPKIPGTLDCSNHRTISLMSHILKVLLKIVLQRVRRKIIPGMHASSFSKCSANELSSINGMSSWFSLTTRRRSTRSDIKIFSRCWRKCKLMTKKIQIAWWQRSVCHQKPI